MLTAVLYCVTMFAWCLLGGFCSFGWLVGQHPPPKKKKNNLCPQPGAGVVSEIVD